MQGNCCTWQQQAFKHLSCTTCVYAGSCTCVCAACVSPTASSTSSTRSPLALRVQLQPRVTPA